MKVWKKILVPGQRALSLRFRLFLEDWLRAVQSYNTPGGELLIKQGPCEHKGQSTQRPSLSFCPR